MAILRDKTIDYSAFNNLVADKLLREWGGERAEQIFHDLIKQGATRQEIVDYFKRLLPSWERSADQLDIIIAHIQGDMKAENGRGATAQ